MLSGADLNGTRPVAYVEATKPVSQSTDPRQDTFHRLNQIALGQNVPAKVLEKLPDGTFLVRLADTTARMSLPAGTKAGDNLAMTLVERQPRPTFLLGQDAAKAGDSSTTLSSAGRLIDRLLQSAQQGGTSAAVIGRVPVLPSPAGSTQVAAALQNAVAVSGLFYESHLAQWAAGRRSLAALMQEPQAQQPGLTFQRDPSQTDAALLRHLVQQWTGNGRSLAELADDLQARGGNLLKAGEALAQQVAGQQAAQLINAQLNTLENQRFIWQGELWPGQKMEWEVSREAPERNAQDPGQETWESVVRFELPTLGTVAATIRLVGDRVSVFVRTASDDSTARLRAHGAELAQAMGEAGSPLDALIVNRDEHDVRP